MMIEGPRAFEKRASEGRGATELVGTEGLR